MKSTFKETKNLRFKRPCSSYLKETYRILKNPNVMRYVTTGPRSLEETKAELASWSDHWEKNGFGPYLVVDQEGNLIGFGKLYLNDRSPFVQLGYAIDEPYWNCGYGSQVARTCQEIAFNQLNQPRLEAFARKNNSASIHILNKLGMHLENSNFIYDGRDYVHYSMTAVEYFGLYQLRSSVPNYDRIEMFPQP
jgi:[ribosomal protein S5]-alanine N-acetyltransferase